MAALDRARSAGAGAAGSAGGAVLAAAARVIAALRPAAKPLHPRGRVRLAQLHRHGLEPALGVPWLDEAGVDEVLVRESRAIGLPAALPDIHGLAVRVPLGGSTYGDLLLASTGWGPVSRFLLTASRRPRSRPMTTLLPYRTAVGPLLLGARVVGVQTVELSCAVRRGAWRHFADLRLPGDGDPHGADPAALGPDPDLSFDPVLNPLPGLGQYPAVQRLREPAYARARRSRGA